MNIFNSLGSNYDFRFVLKTLFSSGGKNSTKELENFLENKYEGRATLVYKGREAIKLGLKSLRLPQKSFVAINGFTCIAVYDAIKKADLEVEYLDIEKGDLNFSPTTLEKALKRNSRIKIVVIQNTLGFPCNIEKIATICKEKRIVLIEDLAHSIGTKYSDSLEAGTVGDLITLSFSQDKIIDGISGGALVKRTGAKLVQMEGGLRWHLPTNQLVNRVYPLFTFLIRNTYPFGVGRILHFLLQSLKLLSEPMDGEDGEIHQLPAWYYNLIRHSINNLEENLSHRRKIATIYASEINSKITSIKINNLISHSSNLRFPIFVKNRDLLISYLKRYGVYVSDIWYDAPISPKRFLSKTNYHNQCPNAEEISKQMLNLPTHVNVSEKDAINISQLINRWIKSQ